LWFDYILTFYYLGIKYEESVHPLNLNPLRLDPVWVNYSFELLVLFSDSITIVLASMVSILMPVLMQNSFRH